MQILLDVDLDFLYFPRTAGNPTAASEQKLWLEPRDLAAALKKAGLRLGDAPAFGGTDHAFAYYRWRSSVFRNALVVHVDAHSDLYESFPGMVHSGNYLGKAMEDEIAAEVVWVLPPWLRNDFSVERFDLEGLKAGLYHGKAPVTAVTLEELADAIPAGAPEMVTVAATPGFVPNSASSVLEETAESLGMTERAARDLVRAFQRESSRLAAGRGDAPKIVVPRWPL